MADIIIIGGGAAGMMAAVAAAGTGQNVVLIEKNEKLGKTESKRKCPGASG